MGQMGQILIYHKTMACTVLHNPRLELVNMRCKAFLCTLQTMASYEDTSQSYTNVNIIWHLSAT